MIRGCRPRPRSVSMVLFLHMAVSLNPVLRVRYCIAYCLSNGIR